ncbi:hypothetical protein [Micromonospora echinospora]|uniref:hypothetical protein n=1 Tax=Micromonospora echinospora TaxID=1877 RepID=UPI003A892408
MSRHADPIEAMERFLARTAPYDAPAGSPTTTVELRSGRLRGRFELTDRQVAALAEALDAWHDPDDVGRCGQCHGRLGRDLSCRECGHLDGIFGATVAQHAARIAGHTD